MTPPFNNAIGPKVRGIAAKSSRLIPVLAIGVLLGGLSAATQYFAHTFQYHASLGGHIGLIYPPWMILEWLLKWGEHYPHQFTHAGSVGMMVTAAGLLILLAVKTMSARTVKPNPYLHGLSPLGRAQGHRSSRTDAAPDLPT